MLTSATNIYGLTVRAVDGELGIVKDLYFDDETWVIRYLTVETGGWLDDKQVLISPISIVYADWNEKRLDVSLTKKQVQNSPNIDTHKPVSRQHEAEYISYYGYPDYWSGPNLWGSALYPTGLAAFPTPSQQAATARVKGWTTDTHLRSTDAVKGYDIEAVDGEIGHLNGFMVDDRAWAIRYLEVATRNWWPGKKVLISPAWVENVSWDGSRLACAVTREIIQTAPEYFDGMPITREYENRLYFHYGMPPYWLPESEDTVALSLISS